MIYHIQTFCTYGYWPEDLSYGSSKLIIVACDRCNEIRTIRNDSYRDLCRKCAANKRWDDPLEREKSRKGTTKHFEDSLEREKQSERITKFYSKLDNPGEQICGHHIAYDFNRPEAFIVKITRKFHTKIHNPKGIPVTERGYSLID